MSIISRRKVRGTRCEVRGVGVIGSMLLVIALVIAGCDFHGPWDYYPEEREVYTGIYTYGYIISGESPDICFSKVYELDESSAENFAFYDSAYVAVTGRFATSSDKEVDTTVVLHSSERKPNCFRGDTYKGVEGESYTMEAFFKWDSSGHKAKSRFKAVATIPGAVKVKGVNAPKPDGSYEWIEYKEGEPFTIDFLQFPRDMEFVKCAMDYEHSVRGVISVMNYDIQGAESQATTINKMFKGFTEEDSTGYRGIAIHDPLETSQNLGFTSNSKVADYYALDTLYLMNMMLPLGKVTVDFYATDAAYIDYEQKVRGSVSDSRVIPESNIENGMGVFSGMSKSSIELFVNGDGVSMKHIAWRNCDESRGQDSKSWDSRGCRLYQDIACSGIVTDEELFADGTLTPNNLDSLNKIAYGYFREGNYKSVKTCYASSVKAAMMLDTVKWSIFLPDSVSEKEKDEAYGDGLKRYCVASNFKSNKIADCGELEEQCVVAPEKNNCKEYLWNWCADRNWDLSYEQCGAALVSRFYIENVKSSILERTVKELCSEDRYSRTCKNWKRK